MKKIILFAIFAIMSLGASAQIIKSEAGERTIVQVETPETPKVVEPWNHSGLIWNILGAGVVLGDVDVDFGLEFGLGYRWHITHGVSWEVIRMNYNTAVSDWKDMQCLSFTSGFRYDSPRLSFLKDYSLYGSYVMGVGVCDTGYKDMEYVWEIGAGVKVNPYTSLGLYWKKNPRVYGYDYDCIDNYGMLSFRIECQF